MKNVALSSLFQDVAEVKMFFFFWNKC